MAKVFSRSALCAVLVVMAGACGGAVTDETVTPLPEGPTPTAEQVAEEMAGYNWHGQEEATTSEVTAQWCPLEYVQPCIAPAATCAVRCCDDTLHKSVQLCGNCGTWATGACANHGTRKRIRWE